MADDHFDLRDLRRRWLPAPSAGAASHPKLRDVAVARDPLAEVPALLSALRARVGHDLPAQRALVAPFLDAAEAALAALAAAPDAAARAALAEAATDALWRVEELLEVYYFLVDAASL